MLSWETMDGDTKRGRGQMESLGGTSDGEILRGTLDGEMLDGDAGQGGIFFFTTFCRLFHLFSRK